MAEMTYPSFTDYNPPSERCPACRDHPSTSEYRWLRHRSDGLKHRIVYWRGGVWSLCGERQFGDREEPR